MAVTEELKKLVEQMPETDKRGMYTQNMDAEKINTTAADIAKGGKESLLGLIEMLAKPGSVENAKPHFALHCVVNHALIVKDEKLRKAFCEAMASQLENDKLLVYNRNYLCQELQWAGRDEACGALGKALLNEDLTEAAAMALAAIGQERAAAPLRAAAAKAKGKCRLSVIDALAALADPKAADIFTQALKDTDSEVRIAAAVGLAKLALPDSAGPLLKLAGSAKGWERTQTTKACLVHAEALAAAGKKPQAKQVYQSLQKTHAGKDERHVQEAVRRGLAAIA